MQSKFRLFVGSLLLFALPAFGQASEPTPAATTAVPALEVEASGAATVVGNASLLQYGDGVYAVSLLPTNGSWTTIGFVRVRNTGVACGKDCDQAEWVISKTVMRALWTSTNQPTPAPWSEGKFPLPEWSVKMDRIGNVPASAPLAAAAKMFTDKLEFKVFVGHPFTATQVVSVRSLLGTCSGTIGTLQCP